MEGDVFFWDHPSQAASKHRDHLQVLGNSFSGTHSAVLVVAVYRHGFYVILKTFRGKEKKKKEVGAKQRLDLGYLRSGLQLTQNCSSTAD